jgi:hypothetical protein
MSPVGGWCCAHVGGVGMQLNSCWGEGCNECNCGLAHNFVQQPTNAVLFCAPPPHTQPQGDYVEILIMTKDGVRREELTLKLD